MIFEWRRVEVHVDEHEATPRTDEHLGQTPLVGLEPREVPLARHLLEAAVQLPGEPVERTPEFGVTPGVLADPAAPVRADVVEGADHVGGATGRRGSSVRRCRR